MPNFSFRALKERLAQRRSTSLDPALKLPLTERNVESFNNDGQFKDTVEEFESESSRQDARIKLQRSREVSVSEWLRFIP